MATSDADDDQKRKRDYWPLILAALASLRFGRAAGESERTTPLDELANVIYALNAAAYEESLRQTVAAAGGEPENVKLANREVLVALRKRAEDSARSIAETYQADLERMLAAVPLDVETEDLAELIKQWSAERAQWKVAQIARTETGAAAGQAQRDFIARSEAIGHAWFGGSLICKLCQQWAGENPYELDAPEIGSHPHVACLDHWEIHFTALGPIWTGD